MLVALSGVQGSGKTSVLNGLKNLGYDVIERKTARSILADWNITLEHVYGDCETSKRFHDELLKRKVNDEWQAYHSNNLVFTERSFADVFSYALISLGHFNAHSDWIDNFYVKCKQHNTKYLCTYFLGTPTNRKIEHDGIRGTNTHYVNQVNDVVSRISKEFSINNDDDSWGQHYPLVQVSHEYIEQRVCFVAEQSTKLWLAKSLKINEIDDDDYKKRS